MVCTQSRLSASKCKDVYPSLTTLESENHSSITLLAKFIATEKSAKYKEVPNYPQNALAWGLKHENAAMDSYLHVQKHLHYKAKLIKKCICIFVISIKFTP